MNHEHLSPESMHLLPSPVLILGPAHSGKSQIGLQCLNPDQTATIIGTADQTDPLMKQRVGELHSHWQPAWKGQEAVGPTEIEDLLSQTPTDVPQVLLDSVNQWLANRLVHECNLYTLEQLHDRAFHEIEVMTGALEKRTRHHRLILISSELGGSLPPSQPLPRILRAALGLANQKLAAIAGTVIWQVAGIPQIIKMTE